jgi:hypothetical protein
MSEKNTAKQKPKINREYVANLFEESGNIIRVIRSLQETLGENLDQANPDRPLSIMIWQSGNSLNDLEKLTGEKFDTIGALHGFIPRAEDTVLSMLAQNVISSVDNLKEYIKS